MSIKTCSRLRLPKRGRTPPCPFSAEGVYPFVSTGIVGQRTMADFQPFPHRPLLSRAQKKAAVATTARLSERVASAFTGEHSENGNPSRVESLPASARRTTPEHARGGWPPRVNRFPSTASAKPSGHCAGPDGRRRGLPEPPAPANPDAVRCIPKSRRWNRGVLPRRARRRGNWRWRRCRPWGCCTDWRCGAAP